MIHSDMKFNSRAFFNWVGHSCDFYKYLTFVLFYSYSILIPFCYNINIIQIKFKSNTYLIRIYTYKICI